MRGVLTLIVVALTLVSCSSSKPVKTVPSTQPLLSGKQEVVNVVPEFKAKPIYVPPEVVRILIMPYEDDQGVLHQGEFVYFTLKQGYWTIAVNGQIQRVKKMVRIVQTQRELSSDFSGKFPAGTGLSVSPNLETGDRAFSKSSEKVEESTSCGPGCQRKLLEIKKYVGKK